MERHTLDEVGIDTDLDGWWEIERNDDGQVTMRRLVIKHNNYPPLVGTLEVEVKPHGNGFNEWLSNKRIIQDDGHSSVEAVEKVAHALDQSLLTIVRQEHKGPPTGMQDQTKQKYRSLVRAWSKWRRSEGWYRTDDWWCQKYNTSPRTLRRARNFVEDHGPVDLREELARLDEFRRQQV